MCMIQMNVTDIVCDRHNHSTTYQFSDHNELYGLAMWSPEKRTQSELYLLEETVAELEPIASLPHSLRLEASSSSIRTWNEHLQFRLVDATSTLKWGYFYLNLVCFADNRFADI